MSIVSLITFLPRVARAAAVVLLVALGGGTAAQAQQVLHGYSCAADRFKALQQSSFSGPTLGCTANDVAITQIAINRNYYPGVNVTPQANLLTGSGCVGGSNITANLNVTVQFNKPARYDIGIFLAEDGGDPQALSTSTGSAKKCTVSILPLDSGGIPNPFGTGMVPSPFNNLNSGTGAYCGDGSNTTIPTAAYAAATGTPTGTSTATFVVYDVPLPCTSSGATSTGKLNVPFVVTWSQNAGNACSGPTDVTAGATSKCNAPSGTLGEVDVVTLPAITKSNGVSSVSAGDTTTYTITVANNTGAAIASQTIKDPSITGLTVTSVACSAAGGAACPAATTSTFATGVTVSSMPNASTLTFTVNGQYITSGQGTSTSPYVPAAGSQVVNTASVTVGSATNSAIDSDTIYYPNLKNKKTVAMLSDPIRGLVSNALSIPGSVAQYSINVTNSDAVGRVDANTVQIDDAIPANTYLYYQLATGATGCGAVGQAVTLTQGLTSSTLTLDPADVQYLAMVNGTLTATAPAWSFVPASGTQPPGCVAQNITNIRANPKGRMAAASSFTLNFNVVVR